MKLPLIICITCLMCVLSLFSTQAFEVSDKSIPLYSQHYDDQRDPFADANAALQLAQKTQRNVMIKVGGNWCGWCMRMEAFLKSNTDVYSELHKHFVVLKINVSDSNENADFMASLPPVQGYPHIYISTAEGKMLISKDTAELYNNEAYSREAWLAFIETYKIQPARS